jgi:hypothetical protein
MTNGDRCRRSSFGGHSCSGLVPTSWWCGVVVASCSRVVIMVMLLCVVSRRGVLAVSKVGWDEGGCTYFRVIIIKTMTNDDIVIVCHSVSMSHSATWHLEPIVVVVTWRESGVVVVRYLCPLWWPLHHTARRWLGPWLVVVIRPSCHVVHLVATLLTATWYLYVLPEQAARATGGFYSPGLAENPVASTFPAPFGLVTWPWGITLRRLVLPGSFWSSLTVVTSHRGQWYGGVAVVDGWVIGAGVGMMVVEGQL